MSRGTEGREGERELVQDKTATSPPQVFLTLARIHMYTDLHAADPVALVRQLGREREKERDHLQHNSVSLSLSDSQDKKVHLFLAHEE